MRGARTLFVFATVALPLPAIALIAACTSGSTADCSPDGGGTPNPNAWCGVPAGDASEVPEGGPTMETGAGDSAQETGTGPEAAPPEAGRPETGSPEAAADAPQG